MAKKIIGLDPGHYSDTAGKRSPDSSLLEYEFNQYVADLAKRKILETNLIDAFVTKELKDKANGRSDNTTLTERCKLVETKKADLLISIHANAFDTKWNPARGWEVFSYPGSVEGGKLAKIAEKHYKNKLATVFNVPNRGCKTANLAMVRMPKCPSILIEFEFFTNKDGCSLLKRTDFREACADVVVATAFEYLGVELPKKKVIAKEQQQEIDYEKETCRAYVNGIQVIALTGKTKCIDYVKAKHKGRVRIQCVKNGAWIAEFRV